MSGRKLCELGPRDCRWPVNDAAPGELHLFCAAPAADERPYCEHHSHRAIGLGTKSERQAHRIDLEARAA